MKQVLLVTCILWATLAISDTYDSDSLFLEANELYNNQNYAQAIDIYQSILDAQLSSFELYYNLANSYFQFGKIPKSILYYEKALCLEPHNTNCLHNLGLAQQRISITEPMPILFYKKWWNAVSSYLSPIKWSVVAIVSVWCTCLLCFSFIKNRKRWVFSTLLTFTFLSVIFITILIDAQQREKLNYAIVMQDATVSANDKPNLTVTAGNKVLVKESLNKKSFIILADGQSGWLENSYFTYIKN